MTRMWRADSRFEFRLRPLDTAPIETEPPRRLAQIAADAPGPRQVDAMLPGERNTGEQAEYGAPMVPAPAARRPAMLR